MINKLIKNEKIVDFPAPYLFNLDIVNKPEGTNPGW